MIHSSWNCFVTRPSSRIFSKFLEWSHLRKSYKISPKKETSPKYNPARKQQNIYLYNTVTKFFNKTSKTVKITDPDCHILQTITILELLVYIYIL